MAAKTFEEYWKILEVPHSRQGNDYLFIKELSEVVWKAATKAAEEKFSAANIRYATALDVVQQYVKEVANSESSKFVDWLYQRLNPAERDSA